ncbi:MAG TPA: SusF/SusE family outer membrane protein [Chitinophagaceae bacterium]|nr:SusF/SusE family outer membrane protein [Chitinophagaceae bacterium]
MMQAQNKSFIGSGRIAAWLLSMLITSFTFSCHKPDDMELNKGNMPLSLSVARDHIVLDQRNENGDGITFNWTSGSNQGTNAAISYTLKIDKQGNNFSNPLLLDLGRNTFSKTFKVGEMNDLLLNKWNIAPNQEAAMEARIVATVSDDSVNPDSTSAFIFHITAYQPVTTTLYLIGSAAPHGWDAGNASEMDAVPSQPGKFKWSGNLSQGELKFITTLGQFSPSYNKGSNANKLFYRTEDAQPDDKFVIDSSGLYEISVDLLNLSISIAKGSNPPYTRLWMLGDATPTGWNIDNPSEMRVDSSNLWVFNYNGILNAGEFKIPVSTGNFGTDYYMPLSNHPAITETGVQFVPAGNPDYKWQITNAGPYKIKLDLQKMTINIQPFTPYTTIWMVGDATPVGWNIDNPLALTPDPNDPYKFSYSGPMNAGEFKFPLATGNWGCDYFMPEIDQSGPGSTRMTFIKSGSPDKKWRITQAGNYNIVIDQLKETISIVKL